MLFSGLKAARVFFNDNITNSTFFFYFCNVILHALFFSSNIVEIYVLSFFIVFYFDRFFLSLAYF